MTISISIHEACKEDDTILVEELIQQGASVDDYNSCQETLLLIAVGRGNQEMVELLLKHNADPNIQEGASIDEYRSSYQRTPLFVATWQGNQEIVKLLLKHNADPNILSRNIRDEKFTFSIDKRLSIKNNTIHVLGSPLHMVLKSCFESISESDRYEIAKMLLEYGANPNALYDERGVNKSTALHLAVHSESLKILQLLLEQPKIDTNLADASGNTPLTLAESLCSPKLVEALKKVSHTDTARASNNCRGP